MIIISYDDGPESDYEVFQAHKKWGVPGEVCMSSGLVGKKGFLRAEQLREMQEAGWEIVSHTRSHSTLRTELLEKGAHPGATTLSLRRADHFKPGTECVVKNGRSEETVMVSGCTGSKRTLVLKRGIRNAYPVNLVQKKAGAALRWSFRMAGLPAQLAPFVKRIDSGLNVPVFSISPATALVEIEESRKDLMAMGLNVSGFTFPYNDYDEQFLDLLARNYTSVRVSGKRLNRKKGSGYPFLLYSHRCSEVAMSERTLEELVKKTGPGHVGIMYSHSWGKGFTIERVNFLIGTALRHGKKIVTRRQLLEAP